MLVVSIRDCLVATALLAVLFGLYTSLPSKPQRERIRSNAIAVASCTATLASGRSDYRNEISRGPVVIWDFANQKIRHTLYPDHDVVAGSFYRDGVHLVLAGYDDAGNAVATAWNTATGEIIGRLLDNRRKKFTAAVFSTDGKQVAVGSIDGKVLFWNPTKNTSKIVFDGAEAIYSMAFAPDGDRLTIGEAIINAFDTKKPARVFMLNVAEPETYSVLKQQHVGGVQDVCFSPDGKRLVSIGLDRSRTIWDVTGREATVVLSSPGWTNIFNWAPERASYSSAGDSVVIGSRNADGLWQTNTDKKSTLRPSIFMASSAISHDDSDNIVIALQGRRHGDSHKLGVFDVNTRTTETWVDTTLFPPAHSTRQIVAHFSMLGFLLLLCILYFVWRWNSKNATRRQATVSPTSPAPSDPAFK